MQRSKKQRATGKLHGLSGLVGFPMPPLSSPSRCLTFSDCDNFKVRQFISLFARLCGAPWRYAILLFVLHQSAECMHQQFAKVLVTPPSLRLAHALPVPIAPMPRPQACSCKLHPARRLSHAPSAAPLHAGLATSRRRMLRRLRLSQGCRSFRALFDPLQPISKFRHDSEFVVLKIYFSQSDSAFCDIN